MSLGRHHDPIVAIATAPGRGAVGIVRASGRDLSSLVLALTGEGNLAVEMTFDSMDDFSPAAIANKVEPLRKLLEARQQLSNLVTFMDGKTGAEELVDRIMKDPELLKSLAAQAKPAEGEGDAQ